MTKYSLTVVLDDAVLKSGSTDKLVLGRKINGKINVLFTGASPVPAPGFQQLQKNNLFQWEDKFKVFFQTEVGKGVLVSAKFMNILKLDLTPSLRFNQPQIKSTLISGNWQCIRTTWSRKRRPRVKISSS